MKEQMAGGEFYYQWGPLVFSLPFKDKKIILENFKTNIGLSSDFNDYSISPIEDTGWKYSIDPDAKFEPIFAKSLI